MVRATLIVDFHCAEPAALADVPELVSLIWEAGTWATRSSLQHITISTHEPTIEVIHVPSPC